MSLKSIHIYKTIAGLSFILLFSAQFFLIYNTYKLKNDQYFVAESGLINKDYYASIHNDKLYPGAQKIIDSILSPNMLQLEKLYTSDKEAFNYLRKKLVDSLIYSLRKNSTMDSLFQQLILQNNLKPDLQYLLVISKLGVYFKGKDYIPLYNLAGGLEYQDPAISTPQGVVIAGNLKSPGKLNLVADLDVSAPFDYSNQLSFGLYVDNPNRLLAIINLMWPTLLLSLFSIALMIGIYFYTFRNWRKQKKLADMKADFVNSITHEFNTPISTIIIANRNVQDDEIIHDAEQIRSLTKIIGRQAQRLKTLFGRVLDITTLNETTLNKNEFYLNNLMEEILLDYRLTIIDTEVSIILNKNNVEQRVLLDRFWFTTMLINIFENAIKYNSKPVKQIVINLTEKEKFIEISIRDNGIGIPHKVLNNIFEKFYRSKNEATKEVSGLGLGLFYTMQGIKIHGWSIGVESNEKSGSNFIIKIPKD